MRRRPSYLIFFLLMATCGCRRESVERTVVASAPIPTSNPLGNAVPPVAIEMQNVQFRAADNIVLNIGWLQGRLVSTIRGKVPAFDDQRSFRLEIQDAEIAVDAPNLTALVNAAFEYPGAPLSDLSVTIADGQLEQRGKLRQGILIPFKIKADVGVVADGRMRLHPTAVSGVGIPITNLMSVLGLELDELIKTRPERGIRVQGNDLLLEPGRMLPGFEMRGKLARATVRGDMLVQTFGSGIRARPKSVTPAVNYLWFREGTITFGKLTMADADLQLIDTDLKDPFDFYPARYSEQLVAGYSLNTQTLGLKTYMPDFTDLKDLPHGRLPVPIHRPRH